ncbi:MAG: peptide deformylase [Candidatus Omnitrophica bacterium]|nr:peptide deformylase [Candidatus Omnitrophota bacterium]
MAIKKILSISQSEHILKAKSAVVQNNDPQLAEVVRDLKDTLLATPNGVGLAAPQIGYLKRVFVLRKDYIAPDIEDDSVVAKNEDPIWVFINPEIISEKGQLDEEEGCLSVPSTYVKIKRAQIVEIKALDENKQPFFTCLKNLGSRAVQQEIDHLNGILILDHME